MKLIQLFKASTVDPVPLNIKAKILSLIACFCAIFLISLLTQALIGTSSSPIIVASMGASAVILFFIPNSPLAQPWPFIGGQICAAFIGMSCALNIAETASASAVAVGASVLAMLFLRCLHPPAAATALAPVMAGDSMTSLSYSFVLVPVGINVVFMIILSILINRWVMNRDYPSALSTAKKPEKSHALNSTQPSQKTGITKQDIEQVLKNADSFVDITATELSHLLR